MEALETTRSDYERERGKPMPSFNHGFVQANLAAELGSRLRQQYRVASELNLELRGRKLVTDLAVFPKRPLDLQHDVEWVQEAPVATIEILTLGQQLDSLLERAQHFLAAGVKSCWIVIPAVGTVAVFTGPTAYRSFANGSAVIDEVLGVGIPLADIFS
jgi:Uma2 family endonuclease